MFCIHQARNYAMLLKSAVTIYSQCHKSLKTYCPLNNSCFELSFFSNIIPSNTYCNQLLIVTTNIWYTHKQKAMPYCYNHLLSIIKLLYYNSHKRENSNCCNKLSYVAAIYFYFFATIGKLSQNQCHISKKRLLKFLYVAKVCC